MTKKVLIVTKDVTSRGGVANYFRVFLRNYHSSLIELSQLDIGSRPSDYYARRKKKIKYFITFLLDIQRLISTLAGNQNYFLIHVNPSLIPVPLIRDGIIVLLSKIFGRKVVVFFHGWDYIVAKAIVRSPIKLSLFLFVFGKADRIVVLAERFKETLIQWGIPPHLIIVSSTAFEGHLIPKSKQHRDDLARFLFLSRISSEKGVIDIMEAASILKAKGLDFSLTFVGFGSDPYIVERIQTMAVNSGLISNCKFLDYLDGDHKFREYSKADIYLLPTYHPEGCPTSVLEAMASGLFVISTEAGALSEIVRDGVNGRIVRPKDPKDLADKMEWAIKNLEKVRQLGKKNRDYAFAKYESVKVVRQIENLYKELLFE